MIQEKAKISISDKVFDKIKYLCNKFSPVEWSGIIWMDIVGTVEDPANLKINITDFTLFDIGTGAYTEFEVDPSIIMGIYNKNPEYITKKYGVVHSHNRMKVFFSGTDTSTLLEQAFIHNFFVSVIVNNDYDKIAKISYKGKRQISETYYNRIGNIMLPYNRIVVEDVVYVIDCDVEYTSSIPRDLDLESQIEILQKKEEERKSKLSIKSWGKDDFIGSGKNYSIKNYKPKTKNQQFFNFNREEEVVDWEQEEKKAEKAKNAGVSFETKCENFVKRVMCIDYLGDTDDISLEEARTQYLEDYEETPLKDYISEMKDYAEYEFEKYFVKELQSNWFEESKFSKLRTMLSSNFTKLLDPSVATEKHILETLDYILKKLKDDREQEFAL